MSSNISQEFEAALPGSGGCLVAHCLCGRIHFATGDLACDYDSGELEGLRLKAKTTPDQYIEDASNDSIGIYLVDGGAVVWNCPCKHLERLEAFLTENQAWIVSFYKARTERLRQEAAVATQQLNDLEYP